MGSATSVVSICLCVVLLDLERKKTIPTYHYEAEGVEQRQFLTRSFRPVRCTSRDCGGSGKALSKKCEIRGDSKRAMSKVEQE